MLDQAVDHRSSQFFQEQIVNTWLDKVAVSKRS
jgi:hypothetical protein